MNLQDLKPGYITNEAGERVSVVLPLAQFEALLEDMEDRIALAQRRNEPTEPWEQVKAELKADGML